MKSILLALAANTLIAIAKYIAAFMSNSGAMMAEAVHSTADSANQILLIVGLKRSKRPPNSEFPLGHGKEIFFWSFIVALLLFSIGGIFSIYEGIHKLHESSQLSSPKLAIGVLIFSILAEGISLYGCYREICSIKGNRSLWEWLKHSRRSELIVVFGEDIAALLGLSFALVAVILTMVTGNPFFDACGSIAIGLLLILVAISIGIKIKGLLIGQGVDPERRKEYIAFFEKEERIEQVLNLITIQMGNDVMLALKAKMSGNNPITEVVHSINDIELNLKKSFPEVTWSFFEPDCKE